MHGVLDDSLTSDSLMHRRSSGSGDTEGVNKVGAGECLAKPSSGKGSSKMYVQLNFFYVELSFAAQLGCSLGRELRAPANWCSNRYFTYYFPFMQWTAQYKWSYLRGDAIAALTMASFYLPMSLSYASNLGHVPPINGLYSYVFNPIIYAFLGSCPQLVVGPEAAGSLLVGQLVRTSVDKGTIGDEDQMMNARVAGVVTGMAGAVILIAGLTRLGFLDSVLSRPFLRGFISAIGFVILVDQLIPELGLARTVKHVGSVAHGSSLDKIIFLSQNLRNTHSLTAGVSFGSFAIIMVCRYEYNHCPLTLLINFVGTVGRSKGGCSRATPLWPISLIVSSSLYSQPFLRGNSAGTSKVSRSLVTYVPAQDLLFPPISPLSRLI